MLHLLIPLAPLVSSDVFLIIYSHCQTKGWQTLCSYLSDTFPLDFSSVIALYVDSLAPVSIRAVRVALFSFRWVFRLYRFVLVLLSPWAQACKVHSEWGFSAPGQIIDFVHLWTPYCWIAFLHLSGPFGLVDGHMVYSFWPCLYVFSYYNSIKVNSFVCSLSVFVKHGQIGLLSKLFVKSLLLYTVQLSYVRNGFINNLHRFVSLRCQCICLYIIYRLRLDSVCANSPKPVCLFPSGFVRSQAAF